VAISNHRLVSFVDGQVTFRWRDSAHHNEQKLLTLTVDKFLRRFFLHVLPKGFVRIRNFGFLANLRRATLLPLRFHSSNTKPLRASARSVSLCLAALQTMSSRLLERSPFTPTSLFSLSAPAAVLCRKAPVHLYSAPSLN
jgi:hypothetical protein